MHRTALNPEPASLVLPFLAAMAGHVFVAVFLALVMFLASFRRGPILDPNDVMEVSMVVLPKSETRMPERATRAPEPKGEATPNPSPAPKPPVESDLSYKTEEAEPKPEGTPDQTDAREALLREARRKQLLDNLDADEGARDREATDPNSTSDQAINTGTLGANNDPVLGAWIGKVTELFKKDFRPLPTIAAGNPNIKAVMLVKIDGAGNVLARKMHEPSGNASYDAAAERAAATITHVPPPPDKYAEESHTLRVEFTP